MRKCKKKKIGEPLSCRENKFSIKTTGESSFPLTFFFLHYPLLRQRTLCHRKPKNKQNRVSCAATVANVNVAALLTLASYCRCGYFVGAAHTFSVSLRIFLAHVCAVALLRDSRGGKRFVMRGFIRISLGRFSNANSLVNHHFNRYFLSESFFFYTSICTST